TQARVPPLTNDRFVRKMRASNESIRAPGQMVQMGHLVWHYSEFTVCHSTRIDARIYSATTRPSPRTGALGAGLGDAAVHHQRLLHPGQSQLEEISNPCLACDLAFASVWRDLLYRCGVFSGISAWLPPDRLRGPDDSFHPIGDPAQYPPRRARRARLW